MNDKLNLVLEKIKEERIVQNVKQKELAAFLNIDLRTYNNIENGKSNITLYQLYAIASFFKKDIEHFVSPHKSNQIINSQNSGIFYEQSSQNNHSADAIAAYKLLVEKLQDEIFFLKQKQ